MDNNKKIPVILDGDPGHDDAIAWVLASTIEEFDIKAITTVAGNQTIDKVTYNAQRIATLLKLNVEIAKGREKPLMADLITAPNFHGESGLDGPILPEPNIKLSDLSAVELMAKVIREADEKVIIITTGAKSNVAGLLLAHPELKEKIRLISTMGGGLRNGNWTAAAEFNILVDPEAAHVVYNSGIPLQMCGLDVTEKALVYPSEWQKIRELDNPIARIVADWFDFFFIHVKSLGWDGATTHDPCAVMSIVHPEIFEIKDYYVQIDLDGKYTRGATIADYRGVLKQDENCRCVVDVDREKFVEYLYEACKKFEGWTL